MAHERKLRPYQTAAMEAVLQNLLEPEMNMVVMPTGSGKTDVIKAIAKAVSHMQILVITPRRKLLKQLKSAFHEGFGVMSASCGYDNGDEHDLVLGTQQTLNLRHVKDPQLILVDEIHTIGKESAAMKFLQRFPRVKVVGFTATPYRDNQHIESLGWKTVKEISILDLIKEKHLVPPRCIATVEQPANFEGNNYKKTDLLLKPLLDKVKLHKRKKILVFCHDISHAIHVAKSLAKLGEKSVFLVHSQLKDNDIETAYTNFSDAVGRSWLINVTIVSMGVDIPCIDSIVILRDVSSFALFVQMLGRGLRKFDGKVECLIFDFGGATKRFGFIDQADFVHSSSTSLKPGVFGTKLSKACTKCETLNTVNAKKCSYCGEEFHIESKLAPASSDGILLSSQISKQMSRQTRTAVLHSVSLNQMDNKLWEMIHYFSDGDISAPRAFHQKPKLPNIGAKFLLDVFAPNQARIMAAL